MGVLWGLLHYGTPSDYAWDVVSGISAGAINTGGIATWATGTEYEMTEFLSEQWAELSSPDIWKLRPGTPKDLLFNEPSFLDDSPALQTIRDIMAYKGSIARKFVVTAVDANTGDYVAMTQKDTTYEDLAQSSMSSGSIPVVFPPQLLKEHVFIDGGTGWGINLPSAIQQCMDIVDDYSNIIVDVAVCGYQAESGKEVSKNALKEWNIARSINNYYISDDFIAQTKAYPGLDVRYYFQERNLCPGSGGLNFNNSTTWCLQQAGRDDAKNMLAIGSQNVSKTLDEWFHDKELKKEYPFFRDYLNKIYHYIFN